VSERREYGDWQTPEPLAREVVGLLDARPGSVVEPTCGTGAFLEAAAGRWPEARLLGWDVNPGYVQRARERMGDRALIEQADFFTMDWEEVLGRLEEPILVLGNPPWVTSAALGALGSGNLPVKSNVEGLKGLDALTGKANFDVSEWMIVRLAEALEGRDFTLAMLCKARVARRVMTRGLAVGGEVRRFDAGEHFDTSVESVLLVLSNGHSDRWPYHGSLGSARPECVWGMVDGVLVRDVRAFEETRRLEGVCEPEWRSGVKHDCARVMEIRAGEVELEPEYVHPMLKGSDVANGRWPPTREMIVTQRRLGEDTEGIRERAPRTWEYLMAHARALDGRKSAVYRGRPRFSVFGVGTYTFAPWKVAVASLYKKLEFMLVGPAAGRPVVLDDTCTFLPFEGEDEARAALQALRSEEARRFLEARIFWDDKRPVKKEILQALDLRQVTGLNSEKP
jgi:hypothetical protein